MKKISVKTFAALNIVASLCLATQAKAATSGNYLGMDIMKSNLSFHEAATRDTYVAPQIHAGSSNSEIGLGIKYKYAFNFNNVFLAPGIFYEKPHVAAGGNSGNDVLGRMTIKDRYGISADLGYDVTDKIAPYLTGGISEVSYIARNWKSNSGVLTSALKNNTVNDFYYGAGIKLQFSKNMSFAFEYNTQRFRAKTSVIDTRNYNGVYVTRLNLFKFGLLYNF